MHSTETAANMHRTPLTLLADLGVTSFAPAALGLALVGAVAALFADAHALAAAALVEADLDGTGLTTCLCCRLCCNLPCLCGKLLCNLPHGCPKLRKAQAATLTGSSARDKGHKGCSLVVRWTPRMFLLMINLFGLGEG